MKKFIICLGTALTIGCSFTYARNVSLADTINQPSQTIDMPDKDVKKNIINDFLQWADQRAKMGNMAVSKYYFDHGPEEDGQLWYAKTPDGNVLIRNASDDYDSSDYNLKALGGVVFYTDANGNTGKCNDIKHNTYDGSIYSCREVDTSKPVDKYLLANNGIVYECKLDGDDAYPDSGFYIKFSDNNDSQLDEGNWIISKDKAAQDEYRSLINKYTHNDIETAIDYSSNNNNDNSNDTNNDSSVSNNSQQTSDSSIAVNNNVTNDNDTTNNTASLDNTTQQGEIIGDSKTHVYHMPGQQNYHISPKNEVVFANEQQAINAGYRKSER